MAKSKNKKKNPRIVVSSAQMRRVKEQCTDEAVKTALGIVYLTLHSEFGFGEKRIERFRVALDKSADRVNSGLVTVDDIQKFIKTDLKFNSALWNLE
jgi:hypothetical protein